MEAFCPYCDVARVCELIGLEGVPPRTVALYLCACCARVHRRWAETGGLLLWEAQQSRLRREPPPSR